MNASFRPGEVGHSVSGGFLMVGTASGVSGALNLLLGGEADGWLLLASGVCGAVVFAIAFAHAYGQARRRHAMRSKRGPLTAEEYLLSLAWHTGQKAKKLRPDLRRACQLQADILVAAARVARLSSDGAASRHTDAALSELYRDVLGWAYELGYPHVDPAAEESS